MDGLVNLNGQEFGIAQATVSTVGTAILIGIGYVSRPSKAALLWSLAFVVAMLSTFGLIVGMVTESSLIRGLSIGVLMSAPALIWSGFRARRRRQTFVWIPALQCALSGAALALTTDTMWFSVAFRVVFAGAAVFAGLTVWESRRIPERNNPLVLPLVLVSAAFVPLGLFTGIAGFLFQPSTGDDLSLVRAFNSVGMLVYLVCAIVSLVSIILSSESETSATGTWQSFTRAAPDRLARAEANDERSWSLIEFRLDDLLTIRDAGGLTSFATIAERLERSIRESFPAEADIARESFGRTFVLVARPAAFVRICIRSALDRVSRVDREDPLAVQLSASVGWASTQEFGYDFDALVAAASEATDTAITEGGGRWRRAGQVDAI